MPVKQLTIRRLARGTRAVVIGLLALDLLATLATLALGSGFMKK
jgi:hypothetical protein